jgi:hypothetical protein
MAMLYVSSVQGPHIPFPFDFAVLPPGMVNPVERGETITKEGDSEADSAYHWL